MSAGDGQGESGPRRRGSPVDGLQLRGGGLLDIIKEEGLRHGLAAPKASAGVHDGRV
jgi:hypothetical protein